MNFQSFAALYQLFNFFLIADFIRHFSLLSFFPVLVAFTTTEHASAQKVVQPILTFCGIYKWIKSNNIYLMFKSFTSRILKIVFDKYEKKNQE